MANALCPDLVVNGETVPHHSVAAEVQNHAAPKGKPGVAWRKAANALAIRTLLLQEARRRGVAADQLEVGPGRFETEEEALIRGLLETAVPEVKPSESEVRSEWARDSSRFRAPPLWEASHILCACDPLDENARGRAYARAASLTRQVLDDPACFPRLAAEQSDCGSKSSGGALGQIGPGDTLPEFESALRGLAEGAVTAEPVLSRHGYHVIRLDAVAQGNVLPFEVVRTKISEAMEKAAWAKAARSFVDRLAASAVISGADLRSG